MKRIYSGCIITSLNTPGTSITLLRLSDFRVLELLDAPSEATAWPRNASYNNDVFRHPIDIDEHEKSNDHQGKHAIDCNYCHVLTDYTPFRTY